MDELKCKPSGPLRETEQPNRHQALHDVYDELLDVIALNAFFYEAIEALNEERIMSTDHPVNHHGLTLFIRHLRQRSEALGEQLKKVS